MRNFFIIVMFFLVYHAHAIENKITFTGGDGSSIEKAVIINGAKDEIAGVAAEREWLTKKYPNYKKGEQAVLEKDKKYYDSIEIKTIKGEKLTFFFDITAFYGK